VNFNSFVFLLFFLVVFCFYWFVFNKNSKAQNSVLLFSGLLFYFIADWRFILLLILSGFFNFYLAKLNFNKKEFQIRKYIFYFAILFNVGILLYFKYFNFFVESFVYLLSCFGINGNVTLFHILLPLGISFFTFQMIGYQIDVNNDEIEPTNNLLEFFTYLFYFPKLLSGPIERVQQFIPQIRVKRDFNYKFAVDGLRQILWGLFKKNVIANNCFLLVDSIFSNYQNSNGSTLLIGAFLYIISLYADFSGYSDMACGISKLFNIRITNNFAFPFFSTNISDYWKKWHISLTSWMMDYIYVPLTFLFRKYNKFGLIISVLVTFIIVGLWHGANWKFIVFGAMHGLYFIPLILTGSINRRKIIAQGKLIPSFSDFWGMLVLFLVVSLTALLGKAENINQGFQYISEIFSMSIFSIPQFPGIRRKILIMIILIFVFMFIEWLGREHEYAISELGLRWYKPIRWGMYYCIIVLLIYFRSSEQQFIYYQF